MWTDETSIEWKPFTFSAPIRDSFFFHDDLEEDRGILPVESRIAIRSALNSETRHPFFSQVLVSSFVRQVCPLAIFSQDQINFKTYTVERRCLFSIISRHFPQKGLQLSLTTAVHADDHHASKCRQPAPPVCKVPPWLGTRAHAMEAVKDFASSVYETETETSCFTDNVTKSEDSLCKCEWALFVAS